MMSRLRCASSRLLSRCGRSRPTIGRHLSARRQLEALIPQLIRRNTRVTDGEPAILVVDKTLVHAWANVPRMTAACPAPWDASNKGSTTGNFYAAMANYKLLSTLGPYGIARDDDKKQDTTVTTHHCQIRT
ncbi:hypothetical protein ANO11243_093490 [Dothideomycetidae sp. 11243]|nr:hypothetical protein ANO11243_093490 [fungal sp. No.11243]